MRIKKVQFYWNSDKVNLNLKPGNMIINLASFDSAIIQGVKWYAYI